MIDERALSHGALSSNKGIRGVEKRLTALGQLTDLYGGRLLDIGCGDGTYTTRLAKLFSLTDAIDIEPDRLSVFRARSGEDETIRITDMSADDLRFPSGSFDLVTAIEVVEHVADLTGTFREVARVLIPGGRFALTTPNRWFPFETHGPVIGGKRRPMWMAPGLPWIRPLHRRWSDARAFTRRELVEAAAAVGLTVVGATRIMPPFDRHPIGRRIRPVTDWIERGPLGFFGMAHVLVFEKP